MAPRRGRRPNAADNVHARRAPAGIVNLSPWLPPNVPLILAAASPRSVRGLSQYTLTVSNDSKPNPWATALLPAVPELGLITSRGVTERLAAPSFRLVCPTPMKTRGPYCDGGSLAVAANEPLESVAPLGGKPTSRESQDCLVGAAGRADGQVCGDENSLPDPVELGIGKPKLALRPSRDPCGVLTGEWTVGWHGILGDRAGQVDSPELARAPFGKPQRAVWSRRDSPGAAVRG